MNKIAIVVAVAAIVVIVAVLLLMMSPTAPQFPKLLNSSTIAYPNGVYTYYVYVGSSVIPLTYVEYNGSALLVSNQNGSIAYLLLSGQRISEYYRTSNSSLLMVSYPELLGYTCTNFTTTQIIEGIPTTVANHLCSAQPFSAPTNFVEIVSALSQAPTPSALTLRGVTSTPFGRAAIYFNSTTSIYLFYPINFTYYLYLLNNKVIYKYSISITLAQYTYNITYLLKSIQPVNSTYIEIISNLSRNLPISDMGGLSLVSTAQRIGMVVSSGQPTVLAFLGLNDTSSAQLLVNNSTLLNGVGLVVLDPPGQPLAYAERLRCLYSSLQNKSSLIDVLKEIYRKLLSNASNPYATLPNNTCPVSISAESALFNLALQGIGISPQTAALPVLIIVYPNGTYIAVTGYNPAALKAALGK